MFFHSKKRVETNRGFTLVELVVSVGIIAIITSLVLTNHSRFNGTIFLTNQAYDVALTIREAQIFGLSVQEFKNGSPTFEVGYGVHFNTVANDEFFIYADIDKSGKYEDGTDEKIDTLYLTRGNTIGRFCATPPGLSENCSDVVSGLNTLDVTFIRPNPDAIISVPPAVNPGVQSQARIFLTSRDGDERIVLVEQTGQISVQNPPSP